MKKIISTILAIDFAIGFCTCGSEPTKKTVETVKTAITETVEQLIPKSTKTVNNPYAAKNLGTFYITFYVPGGKWGRATSTSEEPIHLRTCAVDRSLIPYGSTLLVIGQNGQQLILRANDCGDFGGKQLDIFWDTAVGGSVSKGYQYFGDFGEYAEVILLEE